MNKQQLQRLFPNLENELYDEFLSKGNIKEIHAGEALLRVGQNVRSSFLILEGMLKVYREDEEGKEFFIYLLKPGQACALSFVCAITHQTSNILMRATTNGLVLTIPSQYVDEWMRKYKSWQQFVMKSYHDWFEEFLQTMGAIAFLNMNKKLEFYLKKQTSEFGLHLKLTHHEIARDLNSSREVISRLLKKMEVRKLLILHRNSIEMLPLNVTFHIYQ